MTTQEITTQEDKIRELVRAATLLLPEMYGECLVDNGGSEDEIDQTLAESNPPRALLYRVGRQWRTPTFHIAQAITTSVGYGYVWHGLDRGGEFVGLEVEDHVAGWCGSFAKDVGTTYADILPEGCEICQRCVESLEFVVTRKSQQKVVDRTAYAQRTSVRIEEALDAARRTNV